MHLHSDFLSENRLTSSLMGRERAVSAEISSMTFNDFFYLTPCRAHRWRAPSCL